MIQVKATKFFIFIVLISLISCQDEGGVDPSPDSFCIFKRKLSTNAGSLGQNAWEFIRCDPNPNYRVSDLSKYQGYPTVNCECDKQP